MSGFLVLGGFGLVLLLATLVLGDILEGLNHFEFLGGDWFSTAGLAGFLGALGFVGAIVDEYTHDLTWSIGAGILAGLVVGAAIGWATRALKERGEGSAPQTRSLVGREAVVISAIPAGGYGEVRMAEGQAIKLNARSEQPLDQGTRVWISDVLSATAVQVTSIDALPGAGA